MSNRKNSMNTKTVTMTPEMAKAYLDGNRSNRKIRQGWVNELASMIVRGDWYLTHQGIAISNDGRLLDGQHRLSAIVKANKSVQICVSEYCDEDAFPFIDKGIKRSTADSLQISRIIADIYAGMIKILGPRYGQPGMAMILNESEIGSISKEITEFCKSQTKTTSSAAVRVAAVLVAYKYKKTDDVAFNYANFVRANYDDMTPAFKSFSKQIATGSVKGSDFWELFPKAYKAFVLFDAPCSRLVVGDDEKKQYLHEARSEIENIINTNSRQ